MIYTYSGRRLRPGRAWTDDNGVQHPANWASAWPEQELAERGVEVAAEQPRPDGRFYIFSQNPDGTYSTTERDAATINEWMARRIKQIAAGKILEIAPEWKQRNLIAQSVELLRQDRGADPEADAIQAVWDRIKAIRTHSDDMEASLETLTFEQKQEFDFYAGWPE